MHSVKKLFLNRPGFAVVEKFYPKVLEAIRTQGSKALGGVRDRKVTSYEWVSYIKVSKYEWVSDLKVMNYEWGMNRKKGVIMLWLC